MIPKISVCCFIRDNDRCGFALWESMLSLMPFADEYIIMDCGSTDGTLETLKSLASQNRKIRIAQSSFYYPDGSTDEKVFAVRANDVIALARNNLVLYHQADEIWHEDLLALMRVELEKLGDSIPEDWKGMSFWRYQLQENLQRVKWFPHLVTRLAHKSRFNFIGDGMGTDCQGETLFRGRADYPSQDWQNAYAKEPWQMPTNEMVLDISATGMWLENILDKRRAHAPHWHESPDVLYGWGGGGVNIHEWLKDQALNRNWYEKQTPFNVPAVIKGLLGVQRYYPREDILHEIARG